MVYIHAALFICPSVNTKNRPGCLFGMLPPEYSEFLFLLCLL